MTPDFEFLFRLEERSSLSSQRVAQLENQVRSLESRKVVEREPSTVERTFVDNEAFVVDICSETPNLSEVTHELSSLKFELTKLQNILQQKERELTEVKVKSANVAVAANLENSKQVRDFVGTECIRDLDLTLVKEVG